MRVYFNMCIFKVTFKIFIFNADTDKWTPIGALKQARHGHDAILYQGRVMIVGGRYNK